MYSATFIFDTKQFDDDFHRLDALIAAAAKDTDGYLGEEAWEDPKTGRIANVYYWESEDGLKQLIQHPSHDGSRDPLFDAIVARSDYLYRFEGWVSCGTNRGFVRRGQGGDGALHEIAGAAFAPDRAGEMLTAARWGMFNSKRSSPAIL